MRTVATVATVAVANLQDAKTAPPLEAGAGEARSVWWRLHFAGRERLEIACTPPATRAEVLAGRHDVTAAEPFEPASTPLAKPLDVKEELLIRRWLSAIGERDEATIATVIEQCRSDADAKSYYLQRAAEELPAANMTNGNSAAAQQNHKQESVQD